MPDALKSRSAVQRLVLAFVLPLLLCIVVFSFLSRPERATAEYMSRAVFFPDVRRDEAVGATATDDFGAVDFLSSGHVVVRPAFQMRRVGAEVELEGPARRYTFGNDGPLPIDEAGRVLLVFKEEVALGGGDERWLPPQEVHSERQLIGNPSLPVRPSDLAAKYSSAAFVTRDGRLLVDLAMRDRMCALLLSLEFESLPGCPTKPGPAADSHES
jgi:hypothetical protein